MRGSYAPDCPDVLFGVLPKRDSRFGTLLRVSLVFFLPSRAIGSPDSAHEDPETANCGGVHPFQPPLGYVPVR